jgi:hypothetical protein
MGLDVWQLGGRAMKITRLKRGYRINMSDREYELYLRFVDAGGCDMASIDYEPTDPVERYFNRINGTQKLSDWSTIADDRRVE